MSLSFSLTFNLIWLPAYLQGLPSTKQTKTKENEYIYSEVDYRRPPYSQDAAVEKLMLLSYVALQNLLPSRYFEASSHETKSLGIIFLVST